MALVDYSDSSEEGENGHRDTRTLKRKRGAPLPESTTGLTSSSSLATATDLPPLPSKFHDLYAASSRVSNRDDPSLHGGRTRAIPHIEGNWPTHVYLEWHPTASESTQLSSVFSQLADSHPSVGLRSLLTSELAAPLPLHISLSRPLLLTTDQRGPFLDQLSETVKNSGVRPFDASFCSLDWVPNETRTRFFLVLRFAAQETAGHDHHSTNSLDRLLDVANATAQHFGQPPLYADSPVSRATSRGRARGNIRSRPGRGQGRRGGSHTRESSNEQSRADTSHHFHISIGWTLREPPTDMVKDTSNLLEGLDSETTREGSETSGTSALRAWRVRFDSVKVKVGNVVTSVMLPTKAAEGRGVIGV